MQVKNSPAQLRAASTLLLPAAPDAPLIRVTPDLEVVRIWMDGTHSCDYDMPAKYLRSFLLSAFQKLVAWKEAQGYQLAPWGPVAEPPRGTGYDWRPFPGRRFWYCGPFEALIFKTIDTPIGPAARRQTRGEERLNETGGKVAFRVASYFNVRQHIAEVPVNGK